MNGPIAPTGVKWRVQPTKWRKKKSAPGGKTPYQGFFYPGEVAKYSGDATNVVFRSGMELRLMKFLDESPNVVSWSSEETVIPYKSPLDKPELNKVRRYFMDFKASIKKKDGTITTCLIEVKESTATKPPKQPQRRTRRYLRECAAFAVNSAKWNAAKALCQKQGWEFVILTEKTLRF